MLALLWLKIANDAKSTRHAWLHLQAVAYMEGFSPIGCWKFYPLRSFKATVLCWLNLCPWSSLLFFAPSACWITFRCISWSMWHIAIPSQKAHCGTSCWKFVEPKEKKLKKLRMIKYFILTFVFLYGFMFTHGRFFCFAFHLVLFFYIFSK